MRHNAAVMSLRPANALRSLPIALLLLAACGSTRNNEPFVEELAIVDGGGGVQASGLEADPRIGERLATVGLSTREGARGVKIYSMGLRNISSEPVDVSWTIDWFDRSGERILSARRTWQRAQIEAGAETPIEFTAPNAAAVSWRLVSVDPASLR